MNFRPHNHYPGHRLSVASFTLIFVLGCNFAQAQGTTGTTTDTGTEAVGGTQFQSDGPDLSAFDGIERSESIGITSTQGFGLAADAAGGAATARGGGVGGGGFGGGGGLGGLFGALGGAFGGQGTTTTKPTIRVRLRSAISVPPRPPAEVQQSARRVLNVAPLRSGVQGVNVTMNGRTAILSGAVVSEKDRRMSELLMRLQPGVSQVENRVLVTN